MYISTLKLWNFRKYGSQDFDVKKPDLTVPFNKGMNILIGENDSGKTTIIDAIKLVLKTHAYEWIKVEESDFFTQGSVIAETLRIEIEFSGITNKEAANFTEWCGTEDEDVNVEDKIERQRRPKLHLIYQVERRDDRIIPTDVRAGMDGYGNMLTAEAKDYLKCTFLKALRDADSELAAKKNSRLSQILKEHSEFRKRDENGLHEFEELFEKTSTDIRAKFSDAQSGYNKNIKNVIDDFVTSFIDDLVESAFDLGLTKINHILEKMSLGVVGGKNLGLGTMNRLFMAAELLHLRKPDWNGLRLCMIEELEAHLHPQAQLKIINRLKQESEVQFILTTHSPNISSQADLKDIIICRNDDVFPLSEGSTKLKKDSYKYLERFLDVTKSNLFFSRGNIIVEGWSEEILLPVIAKKLGLNLTKSEVSIINVASTAYLHFAKIFLRADGAKMNTAVSIVTDLDNRPDDDGTFKLLADEDKTFKTRFDNLELLRKDLVGSDVMICIASEWTLEWCLFKSCLSELFKQAIAQVHSGANEFKKDANCNYKPEFQQKLIFKLSKKQGETAISKVELASVFAELLEKDISISKKMIEEDPYLTYLVNAIKHVC
ncbi:ATP-dependent nuclease [Sphingobacterium sp. SG20118]|uniref:ATP-dependent nuclease n=1 Tax=Sphingobacterium sp. SG20118 TaxID=3367156 RepID=UPI0037DFBEBC